MQKNKLSAIILRKRLFNISENRAAREVGFILPGLLGRGEEESRDLKGDFWRRDQRELGEKSQRGLLNYAGVQHSVTSRQPLRTLPTEVFLCGCKRRGI